MNATSPRASRALMPVLALTEITSSFEVSMMYAAMATMLREFGDPVGVGWLITAYLLAGSVSAALCSRLGDLFGRRRLMIVILCCSLGGSLLSLLSDGLTGLILGRALQGMSAALLPLCIGVVREHLPSARVPPAIGWLAAMSVFSAGLGIFIGGVLVDHLGWRWLFVFSGVHALLALVCIAVWVPASRPAPSIGRIDLLGGVLYAPAIALLLWALSRLKGSGLSDPQTLLTFALGAALLALWVAWEWRHPQPLIDVRRLAQRQLGLSMLLKLLLGLGTAQLMLVLLLLAQQPLWTGVGLGLSATVAGLIKLPSNFMGLIGAPWSGHIAARHGARRSALIASGLMLAAWLAMMAWHDSWWLLVVWAMVASLGAAMMFAAVPNLVVEVTPPERTSEFTGLTQVARTIGSAIGNQGASLLLATWTVSDAALGPAAFPSGDAYVLTFGAIAACAAASVAVAFALPVRSPRLPDPIAPEQLRHSQHHPTR